MPNLQLVYSSVHCALHRHCSENGLNELFENEIHCVRIYRDHHSSRILWPIDAMARESGKIKEICLLSVLPKKCPSFFDQHNKFPSVYSVNGFQGAIHMSNQYYSIFGICVIYVMDLCLRFV